MKDFRQLVVWQNAMMLATTIYRVTKDFPAEEKFGVTSQLRRAAVSISTNIAEGCGYSSDPQFSKFSSIAFGSACEVESLILLSHDLGFIQDPSKVLEKIIVVKKMLSNLLQKLNADR